jgi:aminoglycoside phosphotransferase (APT) family kinase protein
VANGWDNVMARLGADLVVRIPRRQWAVPGIETEARWLSRLASLVSVPTSAPIRIGTPSEEFPHTWLICRWLEGVQLASTPVQDRQAVAADLGRQHAALHVPAPPDAPIHPWYGTPLSEKREALEAMLAALNPQATAELRQVIQLGLDAEPWSGPRLWGRSDEHPGNLVAIHRDGVIRLAGLIDWGSLTAGDPALDTAVAWLAFDPIGRRTYRDAVAENSAPIDEATWTRARAWAAVQGMVFAAYSDDKPALAAMGRHALEQVLVD